MVKTEKARELLDVAEKIAVKRSRVQYLTEMRNQLQTDTHDAQTKLRDLERRRSELLVEIGVPLIVTEDPTRELFSEILKLLEGVEQ